MTLPEVLLWNVLRTRPDGLRFRKQYPVSGYVADFACVSHRLLVEIDGDNHSYGDRPERDAMRDRTLHEAGYETLRISAVEVLKNMDGVMRLILATCSDPRPLHQPAAGPLPVPGRNSR